MIDIGEVTSWFVAAMTAEDLVVGDGEAPLDAGWSEGTPNVGTFTPYVVLKQQGPVVSTTGDTPLCDSNAVRFDVPYQLLSYGLGRVESDALASTARGVLHNLVGRHLCGDLRVSADQVRIVAVQGASRDDSTYPKFWSAVTNFTVNVARVQ